jgi:hypothetical protein
METIMNDSNPEFIKCAMEALEEGIRAQEIKEECACRMGLQSRESDEETNNQ